MQKKLVYVLNADKTPLMPCSCARARILLKQEKAVVVRRTPFTIKLCELLEEPTTKPMKRACDTGSSTAGFSVVDDDSKVYYLSEVELRNDIKSRMDTRRAYRRNRRQRKTRYRKPRFDNRANSCKTGRLAPTLKSKIHSHEKELNFMAKILPCKETILEVGNFDTHLMQRPELKDKYTKIYGYQEGKQYGFSNTKEYVKARDNYTCQYCKGKTKDKRLEVHHIIFKSKGGSDREENLITLCATCHKQLHEGVINPKFRGNRSILKHATHMNIISKQLQMKYLDAKLTYGYITKENRLHLNLPKEHYMDAVVIGTGGLDPKFLTTEVYLKRSVADGRYQQTKGKRSEVKLPKGKIGGYSTNDKVLYRNRYYFIKGLMTTGYDILLNIHGIKQEFEKTDNYGKTPKLKDMKRISARKTTLVDSGWINF